MKLYFIYSLELFDGNEWVKFQKGKYYELPDYWGKQIISQGYAVKDGYKDWWIINKQEVKI